MPSSAFSQNEVVIPQLSIQTQSYTHNPETGTFLYRNAKVAWEGITVESTEISYQPESNKLTARGYVRVTEGNMVAVMDELEINIKDGTGIFKETIVYDSASKAYMTAKEVRREGPNKYVAQNCTFTTCNSKAPAWQITGSEINYYTQNFSSSRSSVLRVGGVPVFYFPYLAWPTVKHRQSGFLPPEYLIVRSSVNKWDLGYRIGIPYFWAIDPEQDLTLTYDWVERRGPGLRLDYQYAWSEGMRGEIKYQQFFERDARDPENESGSLNADEIESSKLHPQRFKFQFNHNQQLDKQSRLIASGLLYSDSQFQKEYELLDKPDPNTAQNFSASINRQFSKGSVTFSASQTRNFSELALLNNKIDLTQIQYLPALSFQFSDTFWRSTKTTLSGAVSGSVIRYFRVQGYNGEGITATPRLDLQAPVFRLFNVSINVGKNLSSYKVRDPKVLGSEDAYGFQILDGKAEINTTLSRIYSKQTGIISRFKHLIKTRLQYNYIEDVLQTSDSGVPFGGGVSTQRITTLRLENVLLVKRRYFERSVKLTSLSLNRMRKNHIDEAVIRKLELILGQEFGSEKLFIEQLNNLLDESYSAQLKDKLLSYTEKGVIPLLNNQTRGQTREGKSWTMASLNLVQHYDVLKKDPNFQPLGPAAKGNETEAGQSLLPLRTFFSFTPGPGFSINYFNRYHHQKRQIVEYSASFGFGVSEHNKAAVNFRKNKLAYQTPFGKEVAVANTFGFSNSFETSDELALGFSGTVNLDADSYNYRRRLTSSAFTLNYRPDCWNIRIALTEKVDKTTTSSGREKEYIDRTLYAYINLGGIAFPEQILPNLE
ncbi:MAG: LPS-assembly protein LptD [SAR324 cluster bacterium]|nr:LPS-assembly protein LptD [SAR324 cluster bacterium]MBL7034916.1 LPS-assembly protein LptD [SAR324 cluster bacterium]